ncbi:MAG TPA: 2,3-diaminopropionate biosynthesis protein SbnB [Blastocatellia bacterium]|nr:2,3-diaminopropionate biosynthesis protein SbnB [Blastocatellia bacterium]
MHDAMLILKGDEVDRLLAGKERDLIEIARQAYQAHARGNTSLPHSSFLRFPKNQKNRIIALPAYIGDGFDVAGIKWVSSFPGNLDSGLDRASAVLVLNSMTTGRPFAIMEGSIISAKRTAASAAVAAECLLQDKNIDELAIIGCGLISHEILRFLKAAVPTIRNLVLYDLNIERARQFKRASADLVDRIEIFDSIDAILQRAKLISFATTAACPHVLDATFSSEALILHVSLRDLSPEVILSARNVVDDADHVSREQTSIHLAEQLAGNRSFISCSIGDILIGKCIPEDKGRCLTIFSPFGLGILDIAVGRYIYQLASEAGVGTQIESFLPRPWVERASV